MLHPGGQVFLSHFLFGSSSKYNRQGLWIQIEFRPGLMFESSLRFLH